MGRFQERMTHESSVVTTASATAAIGHGSGALRRPAVEFSIDWSSCEPGPRGSRIPRYPVVTCGPSMRADRRLLGSAARIATHDEAPARAQVVAGQRALVVAHPPGE